ncbi:unnamed protein product [Urochloa decumbens]|uniref:FBD domain-containing protein n=1 Tax=Urochloa decumbens TaxID=240449 RepID=A0ABC9DJW2_9POAL
MGKKTAAKSKRPRLAAAAEESGSQQPLPAGGGDPDDLDQSISRLTDDLLLEIVKLLPTADGCRSQILSSRWRPLWPSTSPSYKAMDYWGQEEDRVAANLRVHPGPIRRFSLRWFRGAFEDHPGVNDLLRQPVLDNLQVLELSYAPNCWAEPNLPPPAVFRIYFSMGDACCNVDFPQLEQLTLKHIHISEDALHAFLSRCHVLQTLVLHDNIGYRCLQINSLTLYKLGITDGHIRDTQSQEYQDIWFEEVVIEHALLLERLSLDDIIYHMKIRVIHAPKLKKLGYIYFGDATMVFKGAELVSLTNAIRTVKILCLNTFRNVDVVIGFLQCFPCVEELDLVDIGGRIENAQRDVSLECLDAHLKNVQLKPYTGRRSQVQLIRFFLANAKVLESMTFADIVYEPDAKWVASQHKKLMLDNRASHDAKFCFSKPYYLG